MSDLKEKIAIQCYTNAIMVMFDQKVPLEPMDWDELLIVQKEFYRKQSDDLIQSLNLVQLDEDQSLPEVPLPCPEEPPQDTYYYRGYRQAQQDMRDFKRVKE